ncbi:hypothetical protein I4F81_004901 [Pyropia yezoensis]|uniref:Uncharacterized protein n=1 Tax=Pyropia yezoensis TaxID=2788 RepID=A0ACC3BWR1_PYRYE|nr:hypothetical protein I4F81_004901 [Neopyropia yezoensis]
MRCAFVPVTVHAVCSCPSRSSAVSTVRAGSRAWRAGGAAAAARLLPRQAAVEPRAAPLGVHMLSSNELRPGVTVEMDGSVWRVTEFLHVKPGKGAAFVRTKLKNMETGAALEKTFKAGESVKQASLEKISMQHTYVDGDDYVFMNMETYDEERLTAKVIGDRVKYMKEGLDVEVLKHNDRVLDVDLPTTITLRVADTEPGVRGNTANNALKPAKLETGATVMVPLFIEIDELVSVNTVEGKYLSRAKE